MTHEEVKMALEHNGRIHQAWPIYESFIIEGESPDRALSRTKAAMDAWQEYFDQNHLAIPTEDRAAFERAMSPMPPLPDVGGMMREYLKAAMELTGKLAPGTADGSPIDAESSIKRQNRTAWTRWFTASTR